MAMVMKAEINAIETEAKAIELEQNLSSLAPILQRIYARRGILSLRQLDRHLSSLLPYYTLSNIKCTVQRLATAIAQQQRILIIGDFDTDGATSTVLAVGALHDFGAKYVDYLVPNRFTYGYGLSPEIVAAALSRQPDIIITVDNGISSHAGVEAANANGIDVIITDHHLPADTLPAAYAIINPNLNDDAFASKHLAGVGVVFYLMLALRAHLEQLDWFTQQNLIRPNLAHYLDLVALGTVADMVKLDHNNRILVYHGLNRIRAGHARPGISALLQVAGRKTASLQANDLGFAVAPRLNAAGRLDDMSLGVNCLLATDVSSALACAQQLDQLNHERRALEAQMQQEAFTIIQHLDLHQKLPLGICLYDETWHQGVVGLVASRVKDKLHRPVIAFATAEEGIMKGSARSIPGIHIRDMLALVDSRHPYLINKFGGHAMAAGLSIYSDAYPEFAEVFAHIIVEQCDERLFQRQCETDGPLQVDELTLTIAELLRDAGPWGQGFSEPLFSGCFRLLKQRIVGERHLKMTLQIEGEKQVVDAIAFQVDLNRWPNVNCERVSCLYRLDINEYKGQKKLQLIVEELAAG